MNAIAIVNKMDPEEIEEFYQKEVEKADNFYLNSIRDSEKKLTKKQIKEKYDNMLKTAIENYRKQYDEYFKSPKKISGNEKQEKKQEKEKQFKVEKLNLELNFKEKFKLKYNLFKFRKTIAIKNLIRKIMPIFLSKQILKTKIAISEIIGSIKRFFRGVKKHILKIISKISEKIKNISKLIYTKLKKTYKSLKENIISVFIHKKENNKDNKDENKEKK